jgi:hypothetical protein
MANARIAIEYLASAYRAGASRQKLDNTDNSAPLPPTSARCWGANEFLYED